MSGDEVSDVQSNLKFWEWVINNHDRNLRDAAKKLAAAKDEFNLVLSDFEKAPDMIEMFKIRLSKAQEKAALENIDPRIKKIQALQDRIKKLEEELGKATKS